MVSSVLGVFFAVELFVLGRFLPVGFWLDYWLSMFLVGEYALLAGLALYFLSFVEMYVVERVSG